MANIALNKPSGGQLILSPEDGTSTETVTIPSSGNMGKVLQVQTAQYNGIISASGDWDIISLNITPVKSTSLFLITFCSSMGISTDSGDWGLRVRSNGANIPSLMGTAWGSSGQMTFNPSGTDNGGFEGNNSSVNGTFTVPWLHGQSSQQLIAVRKVQSSGDTTVTVGRTSWTGSTTEQLVTPTFLTVMEVEQ
jgi:hypothetical protein